VTLVDAKRPAELPQGAPAEEVAAYLGLDAGAAGLVAWDVFEAVLTPGDVMVLASWRARGDAEAFARRVRLPDDGRLRCVRVVRDYGMYDRREAPQFYPDVARGAAL
jgi:hypothetical protein